MAKNKTKKTCLANKVPITLTLVTKNRKNLTFSVDRTFLKLVYKSGNGYGTKKIKAFCCEAAIEWAEVLVSAKEGTLEARTRGNNIIIVSVIE